MKKIIALFILMSSFLCTKAQLSFTVSCSGQPFFNSYQELANGKTQSRQVNVTLQGFLWLQNINRWKLTVRLIHDFYSLNNSIDAEFSSLQYNYQINYSQNSKPIDFDVSLFPLSKFSETVLVNSTESLNGLVRRAFSFDLNIQGGTHLLSKPNGSYQSAYEFKLYEVSNYGDILINSFTTNVGNSAGFSINYIGNVIQNNIVLQNGADQLNLVFANAADFATGKTVKKVKGLKVTSISNYQIAVRAANSALTSASSLSTLPVSVLKVEVEPNPPVPVVFTNSPLTLSATEQVIAVKYFLWLPTIEYDLTFSVLPNTKDIFVPAGTYSTFVYFSLMPN